MRSISPITLALLIAPIAGAASLAALSAFDGSQVDVPVAPPAPAPTPLASVDPPACGVPVSSPSLGVSDDVRGAAQRGLDFLATDTVRWQRQHNCYGCHVQAVTLQAMAVGAKHQYEVDRSALDTVIQGMTALNGGSHGSAGLSHQNSNFFSTSRAMGGAGFALFDAHLDPSLRDELLKTAAQLRTMQGPDGAIISDFTNPPVAIGAIEDTVYAMVTWNQAYARTADDAWLTAVAQAESWLQGQIRTWATSPPTDVQPINYALIGLAAAGTGATEPTVATAIRTLKDRQRPDGGWSLRDGGASDAFATGQTLYSLRRMGHTDNDPQVAAGSAWLLSHQQRSGGWSAGGSSRAEAMWAVLGLVSVDVLSVAVEGVRDGTRLEQVVTVDATATDHEGGGVLQVELFVDDLRVAASCGDHLTAQLDPATLQHGPHLVDIVATNADGRTARRRMEVYTGPHYLARIGSTWENGQTTFGFRDLADTEHEVRMTVHPVGEDGLPSAETLHTLATSGDRGPMSLTWTGEGALPEQDKYVARFEVRDRSGAVLQQVDQPFTHDSVENRRGKYGDVGGQLSFADGDVAANAQIELLNQLGYVEAVVRSTREGRFQFKDLKEGAKYKVRMKKPGFEDQEIDLAPVAAGEAQEAAILVD